MGSYKTAIITTAGQSLIAQALAGTSAVKFTSLKTSNHSYAASTDFEALTSLQDIKQSADITSAIVVNQTTVKISARVSNVGITTAYYINTIGVYAETDGITETLIAVIPASTADLVPAFTTGAPYSFIYDINLTIQNSSSLNVTINDSGVATVADLEHFYEKVYDVYVSDTASGTVASFKDGANKIPMESVNVNMSLSQSFNGYDKPWAPGLGKNKIKVTNTNINKGGDYTFGGITFSTVLNGSGDVLSITANGTATRRVTISLSGNISNQLASGTYIVSGCPSGGSFNTYCITVWDDTESVTLGNDGGSGAEITLNDANNVVIAIDIKNGVTINNLVFKPMIRLATETNSTFEPYSNVCPVSGENEVRITRTGKNLFPYPYSETTKTVNDITFTDNGDGTISAIGTAAANAQFNAYTRVNNPFTLPVGTYIVSGCPNGGSSSGYEIAINDTVNGANHIVCHDYGAGATFEVTDATHLYGLYIMIQADQTVDFTFKPMIRLAAESDATFEPYTSQIATASLGQTVYGGTVDVVTGVMAIDEATATFGPPENQFLLTGPDSAYTRSYVYRNATIGSKIVPIGSNEITKAICAYLPSTSRHNAGSNDAIGLFQYHNNGRNEFRIAFPREDRFSTVEKVQAWMDSLESRFTVYYPLATPQTAQTEPLRIDSLYGYNNVWSDAGDVDVKYRADTTLYINKKIAEMQALILENS